MKPRACPTPSTDANHETVRMGLRASVQGGRGQLLSITGRTGAPSPSRTDHRLRILNNITRLHDTQKNDNIPVLYTVTVPAMQQNLV